MRPPTRWRAPDKWWWTPCATAWPSSSSLAVFDGRTRHDAILYLCRAETSRIISAPLLVGSSLPSYCTSNGRVLLAALTDEELDTMLVRAPFPARTAKTLTGASALREALAEARAQGWAIVEGELEAGLRSIAVPVRDGAGKTVAALNIATQSNRRGMDWLTGVALPELQAAAAHLSRVM